jgi:hypothetical protein
MKDVFKQIERQIAKVSEILSTRYNISGNILTNKQIQNTVECQEAFDKGVMVGSLDGLKYAKDIVEKEMIDAGETNAF